MPSKELALADHFDQMNDVAALKIEGYNPSQIAKTLGIPRADVLEQLDNYRALVSADRTIQARAKEALYNLDEHFNKVTRGYYEVIEQVDEDIASNGSTAQLLGQKTAALRAIVELESKRVNALKDFGAYESMEIGSQIAETERKQEILVGILRDVTYKCNKCKFEVAERIAEVTGQTEGVVIVQDAN